MYDFVLSHQDQIARIQGFPYNHGITTRKFGDCAIGNGDKRQKQFEQQQNWRLMKIFKANNFHKLIAQHSSETLPVQSTSKIANYYKLDGLIYFKLRSQYSPVLISGTADCPIAFLATTNRSLIGIIHSGRLGTKKKIIPKTINILNTNYGIAPQQLIIGLWPGICPHCYPVDLKTAILTQILDSGIPPKNIYSGGNSCSAHSTDKDGFIFASHSRDHNGERNAAFITF